MADEGLATSAVVDVTAGPHRVEVRERGTQGIPGHLYEMLYRNENFQQLIEDGIVSLVRSKHAGTAIRAGAFVGSAHLEGIGTLTIAPKIPGALESLLEWSVPADVRASDTSSTVASDATILEIFISRFLDALANYLTDGRLRQYAIRKRTGSVPHGRIDVRATMALEARGRPGVLAYRERHLSATNDLNKFLGLAVFAAQEYCVATGTSRDLARLRTFAALFEDVGWRRLIAEPLDQSLLLFGGAERLCRSKAAHNALLYGRALLLHLGAWPTEASTGITVPNSFFLNLESLFEEAVRNVLQTTALTVRGSSLKTSLFTDLDSIFVADPDVVVLAQSSRTVIDMKYKDLKGSLPGNDDFYQLHSHAKTLGANTMALIFPLETAQTTPWAIRDLGRTRDGVQAFVGQVDVARIVDGTIGLWQALTAADSKSE